MCRNLILICLGVFAPAAALAQAFDAQLKSVEMAYRTGDYAGAYQTLSQLPGLLGVVPVLDRPTQRDRAQIFFRWGASTWHWATRPAHASRSWRHFTSTPRPTRGS